jgi:hypothetical protein
LGFAASSESSAATAKDASVHAVTRECPAASTKDASALAASSVVNAPLHPEVAASPRATWPPTHRQIALTAGAPFFDESILHGDLTLDLRVGYKIWWLVPYVSGGYRMTRMDPAQVPDIAKKKKLLAWHATFGVRLEIPASRHLYPFAGIAGELARWAFTNDTSEFCHESYYPDAWRCYDSMDWKPGKAIKVQVGLLYKPQPDFAVELWLERGTVYASEMFTRRVTFYSPGIGMAWHF